MVRRCFRSLSVGAAVFLVVARQGHWISAPLPQTPKPVARSFFLFFFCFFFFIWPPHTRPPRKGAAGPEESRSQAVNSRQDKPPLLSPLPFPPLFLSFLPSKIFSISSSFSFFQKKLKRSSLRLHCMHHSSLGPPRLIDRQSCACFSSG